MRRDLPVGVLALAVVVVIGLLSAGAYFRNAGLPANTDAELHVYRTAELAHSVQAGNFYPRWAPDFFYGYGYPIFNYYAPLTYHLGTWFTLGHPERAAEGARISAILAQFVGVLGAYQLGKRFAGRAGGLLGALAFAGAPYVLFINPHIRGDLPESLAVAFVPWALWGWERVWDKGTAGSMVAAVLATAAVFLSHNLTGLTIVALAAGLGLWRCLAYVIIAITPAPIAQETGVSGRRSRAERARLLLHPHLARAVVAALIFVLLTAFFWLPFLAERSAIRLDVAGEGHYDFRNHFVSADRLFARLTPLDRSASVPDVPMTTGLVPVIAAIFGTSLAIARRRFSDVGFYAFAAALLLWLMMPSSQVVWETLPGLEYYQFPWRFLGPLAVLFVPLVAYLALPQSGPELSRAKVRRVGQLEAGGRSIVVPAISAVTLLVGALPGLYPPAWDPGFGLITPKSIIDVELEGRWRGTTSTNDFVPSTVDMIPGPQSDLLASYEQPPVDRVNRYTLPAGTTVETMPSDPWINRFDVQTAEPFTLRLYLFDFPGWLAFVDGQPVPIEIAHPEGFITVAVPKGQHEVVVQFGSTPVRRWAWLLSATGLGALFLVWGMGGCKERFGREGGYRSTAPCGGRSEAAETKGEGLGVVAIATAVLIVLVIKAAGLDPRGHCEIATPLGDAPDDVVAQQADFGDEISLLGYSFSTHDVAAGRVLDVKLVWMASRPMTATYQSFVHLVYPEGQILAQSDHLNPGGFPTNLWPLDRYIVDRHQIRIPEHAAPGSYLVSVGLFTLDTNTRVPVGTASCGQRHDSVVLCDTVNLVR